MSVDQIVEEISHRRHEKVAELVDRLTRILYEPGEPELDMTWKQETRRRLAEIENGNVQVISDEQVSVRVWQVMGRASGMDETATPPLQNKDPKPPSAE